MTRFLALAPLAALAVSPAFAGDLMVRVGSLPSAQGRLVVSVCTEAEFLKTCRISSGVPARTGTVEVKMPGVAPGRYAVQVYHDRNGNGQLDVNFIGIPTEPYGLSRNPPTNLRAPRFDETVVDVGATPQSLSITLRGT